MNNYLLVLTTMSLLVWSSAQAADIRQFPSEAAAIAALTGSVTADADDVVEIPFDTPTTNTVRSNVPVAGETGQL